MAYKNKIIQNPKTGQQIKFLQTAKDSNGALLEMETTYDPFSTEPVEHYHTHQQEDFAVTEGELHVKMNGQLCKLKAGDTLHVPVNTKHAMWNNSGARTIVNWKVIPAMDTEYFLETSMGLAADNKTDERGVPGILQVALMAQQFSQVFRMSKPPFIVQLILFSFLKPFAQLAGYRATYPGYID